MHINLPLTKKTDINILFFRYFSGAILSVAIQPRASPSSGRSEKGLSSTLLRPETLQTRVYGRRSRMLREYSVEAPRPRGPPSARPPRRRLQGSPLRAPSQVFYGVGGAERLWCLRSHF